MSIITDNFAAPLALTEMGTFDCKEECLRNIPANIYLFKVGNRNFRKRCEICSKLAIKTPERRQ